MSKRTLNALIRQMLVAYVAENSPVSITKAIDFVTQNMTDPRVTRERVSGNISAICCVYHQLSYANGYLR